MVRRAYAQRSLFEVLLPDGDKLWTDELRTIDELLDDDELVDLVDAALRSRHPLSGGRGRLGTPATVVLNELIHRFHQGPARELYVRYDTNQLEAPVAYAIVTGVLDRKAVPAEVLDHVARMIRFYEERASEAARNE